MLQKKNHELNTMILYVCI